MKYSSHRTARFLTLPTVGMAFFVVLAVFASLFGWHVLRQAQAAGNTCTWTNGAATGLWNNTGNWSGCAAGAEVPGVGAGIGDTAVFDTTSVANVSIDAAVSLTAFNMNAGYTGTITQNSAVTTAGYTQVAGTFTGTAQTFTDSGTFSSTGAATTFTAPSTSMSVSSTFTAGSSATFNNNSGTITFDGTTTATLSCNSHTFNLITFTHTAGTKTVSSGCTFPMGSGPTTSTGGSISLTGTLSGSGTLTLGSAGTANALTINSTGVLSGFGGLTDNGNLTLTGATLNAGSYSPFTVNNFVMNSTPTFTAPSGTMSVATTFTITNGTFTHNSGTVNFNGGTATLSCNSATFNLVTFTHTAGTKTVSSNCSFPLGAGPSVGSASGNLTLAGTLSGSGTITFANAATLNSTAVLSGFSGLSAGNFTQSGGTQNFGSYSPFTVSGVFTLSSSAAFTAPSGTLTVKSSFTIDAGTTFTHNSGTLNFDVIASDATLSCNSTTFNLVTITATSRTKTISSNCSFPLGNNPTTGNGGSITLSGTLSGTGTLSIGTTSTSSNFVLNSTAVLSGFSGLSVAGPYSQSGGTQNFGSYSPVTFLHNFSLNSSAIFTAPTGTMTVGSGSAGGNFTINSGTTFTHNSGTLVWAPPGTATMACNSEAFNLVTLSWASSGTKTINSDCSLPLGASPSTPSTTLVLAGTLTGSGTLTMVGTVQISGTGGFSGFGTVKVPTFTINGGATFTAPAGTLQVTTFTNSGTFNNNGGTVAFATASGAVSITSAAIAFATLTVTDTSNNGSSVTITLPSATTLTIETALVLDGLDANDLVSLVASTPTSASTFSFTGSSTFTGDNLSVKDNTASDSSSGVTIPLNPASSTNAGNTTNWFGPWFDQAASRFFNNAVSTDVGTPLAAQDTIAVTPQQGTAFRLRMLHDVSQATMTASFTNLKLQIAAKSGTCDTAFSGESYADVAAGSGAIRYYDNAGVADDAALTANANDPSDGKTKRTQTYNEANPFTNSVASVAAGETAEWDFALVDNSATPGASYCFRAVYNNDALLQTYTVIPEIATNNSLAIDIVDGSGNPVASPTLALGNKLVAFTCQTSAGTLGTASQKIRVSNTTINPSWSVSIAASGGSSAVWANGGLSMDFNDPTSSGCVDGADTDTKGGQLGVDPSVQTITPQGGCATTGISSGTLAAYDEGVTDAITMASSDGTTQTNCYWDVTGDALSQKIPVQQSAAGYSIGLVVTVVAL